MHQISHRRDIHKNITDGKSEGKGPLGRQRIRKEDNIKADVVKAGLEDVEWVTWL